ncbi:MAG TPA: class I SAM-dependent methyltransferase [Limnochordales bacterium]
MSDGLMEQLQSFRHRNLDELLDFASQFGNGLIAPWQVRSEIRAVLEMLAQRQPRTMLEIGTANGGSLFLFCRVLPPRAQIISVDLPGGPFGGGYDLARENLYRAFALPGQELHLIRADSHQPETRQQVADILRGTPLDFLFIDGDHTFRGVQADFSIYGPLVHPQGLVAFHDIVVVPPHIERGVEVNVFWQRVKRHYRFQEFIENPAQGWGGIGVIERRTGGPPWGIDVGPPPPPQVYVAPPPAPPPRRPRRLRAARAGRLAAGRLVVAAGRIRRRPWGIWTPRAARGPARLRVPLRRRRLARLAGGPLAARRGR